MRRGSWSRARAASSGTSPGDVSEGTRVLGPRRRPQVPGVHATRRRRVRDARPAPLGGLPPGRTAASTRSTRWPPTWAAWASSPPTTPQILHNNSLINLHTLEAARGNGVKRYLYTSSACVYPEYLQTEADVTPLQRGGRLPGPAAGRLRLGEADHRAALPALPRGLRHRDPHRPLPQHLRPARHLGRRPREGARGAVPQDRRRPS